MDINNDNIKKALNIIQALKDLKKDMRGVIIRRKGAGERADYYLTKGVYLPAMG